MSNWPLVSDFARMLQTPKAAFRDPNLRECTIEKDQMGQPKARSGNFATVFRAYLPDRTEAAVRVFNRFGDERRERYDAVSRYLENRAVSSVVRFNYDERGIRSAGDGKLYPLVTMEWVPGLTLFEWCRDRCREGYREALAIAADVWLQLVRELAANDIVHGDLQHANVLVSSDGHFKLVDYDCMAVPQLLGRRNLELGMVPYQHPGRDENTQLFTGLDHFSSLVIYVALRALAADPRLWRTYVEQLEYDRLLFRREDFENPAQSHLHYELMNSPDEQVRDLTHYLFELRRYELHNIPPIDEVLLWCNSLEQLLSARDWDTAVELVKRMSPSEQIPYPLQPIVEQAHRRVHAKNALEKALEAGDEAEVQRQYVPELLDDYPAAAPLVEQARQAGQVRQLVEVLRAAKKFQRWDLFMQTWREHEGLLDKRTSMKEFKAEYRKIDLADKLRKLLEDRNSDDQAVTEIWNELSQLGGHSLVAGFGDTVQARAGRQQALVQLKNLVEQQPNPPTYDHDKQLYLCWKKDYFEDYEGVAPYRPAYRAAVKRLQKLQQLRKQAAEISLENERAVAAAFEVIPESYDPSMASRVRVARQRLAAAEKLAEVVQRGASDQEVSQAWQRVEHLDAQPLVDESIRQRVTSSVSREDVLRKLAEISDSWPPTQIDSRLLEIWNDALLQGSPEAARWRPRYLEARRRKEMFAEIRQAADAEDRDRLVDLANDPQIKGFSLPEELGEKIATMVQEAQQEKAARRQHLTTALRNGDKRTFRELFDAEMIAQLCEQFGHHQPVVGQWIESELVPAGASGLGPYVPSEPDEDADKDSENGNRRKNKETADAPLAEKPKPSGDPMEPAGPPEGEPAPPEIPTGPIEKRGENQFRIRWTWPRKEVATKCRLVICAQPPHGTSRLDDLDAHFAFTIDRSMWEAAGGYRDVVAQPEWEGAYAVVWAVIDVGFQEFNTEPLVIGRLQEEKKKGRWSLFGRK